jgi:hypothetical protein
VSAVNDALAFRDFIDRIDENCAFALEFLDDETVVDNFLADVDRRAEGFKSDADDVDRPDNSGAESAGLKQK